MIPGLVGLVAASCVIGLQPGAVAGGGGADAAAPVPVATILSAPDSYEGRSVLIRGTVVSVDRAVFPNGRPYYALSVGDERTALTVFSWARPSVEKGDLVEATGVFHVWRYNLHHMIEGARIIRLEAAR